MLFCLTDSLIVSSASPEYNTIKRAVRLLAEQVEQSHHLLMGSEAVIAHFRGIFRGDDICYPLFNTMYQNFALLTRPTCVNVYVEIVQENPVVRTEGNCKILQVKYDYFLGVNTTLKAVVIGEDFYDTEFFEYILSWYKCQVAFGVSTDLESIHGAGIRLAHVIDNELKKRRWVVAFADTDCRYPGCKIKKDSTAYQCLHPRRHDINLSFSVIDVHEVENLIPLNFIDQFEEWKNEKTDDAVRKKSFDYLRKDAENILPYFDYKKGIVKKVWKNKDAEFLFAKTCYEQNDDLMRVEPDFEKFLEGISDGEIVYPLLFGGTGVIKRTVEMLRNGNQPIPVLCNYQAEAWRKIGQELLNWSICRGKETLIS